MPFECNVLGQSQRFGNCRVPIARSEWCVERREELWLGTPQTPLYLPGPGAEPQRKLLTTPYALRTQIHPGSGAEPRLQAQPRSGLGASGVGGAAIVCNLEEIVNTFRIGFDRLA